MNKKFKKALLKDEQMKLAFHLLGWEHRSFSNGFRMVSDVCPKNVIRIESSSDTLNYEVMSYFPMAFWDFESRSNYYFKAPTVEAALAKAEEWIGLINSRSQPSSATE